MYRAETSKVWLSGKPLDAFVYADPQSRLDINTDASAYRPDPRNILAVGRKYTAQLVLERVLIDGKYEDLIRMINISGQLFAKIR